MPDAAPASSDVVSDLPENRFELEVRHNQFLHSHDKRIFAKPDPIYLTLNFS